MTSMTDKFLFAQNADKVIWSVLYHVQISFCLRKQFRSGFRYARHWHAGDAPADNELLQHV